MTASQPPRQILFVAPKRHAQPVLSQLRSAGHHVSLVEDLDEARAILGIGRFDQAVVNGESLQQLLEQRMLWESHDGEQWRRSTAAIVHDLRGLFNALSHVLDTARAETRAASGGGIDTVSATVETLSSLAEELMQELVSTNPTDLDVPVVVEDVIEAAAVVVYPLAAERLQNLTIDIDPEITSFKTNPSRLKRVLKNLLEFTSAHADQQGAVSIDVHLDGSDCLIAVSCRGKELSRSELRRLFHPSTDYGGRSGPLVLAQEIVGQLQGRLWIESERGAGVTVYMAVPYRKPSLPRIPDATYQC